MKITIGKKIVGSFSVVFALLIILVGFSFLQLSRIHQNTRVIIDESIPLSGTADNLLMNLMNQETGVRGFVATGDEAYLEPYYIGKDGIAKDLEIIAPYLDNHPIMAGLIEEAKPKIKAIEEYFASVIDLVSSGNIETARTVMGDGKKLFDDYRATDMKILQDIEKLTNDTWLDIQHSQEAAKKVIFIVMMVACAITICIVILLTRSISKPMKKAVQTLNKIAEGDLTVEAIKTKKSDEIADMIRSLNAMIVSLKGLVSTVGESSEQIASMSEQLSSATDQNMYAIEHITTTVEEIATGANTQSNKVEDTNKIVNLLSEKIHEMTMNAKIMSQSSMNANATAKEGHKHIDQAIDQMKFIDVTVNNSAAVVAKLGEKIQQIGSIIGVINNIAAQTNLLALNAAIEAARAGEAGRGFTVVAEEVRGLAEQSNAATKNISSIITEVQQDAKNAIEEMGKGTNAVSQGSEVVNYAGGAFNQILSVVDDLTKQIQDATIAIEEIDQNSEKMVSNVNEVSEIAQATSSGTQTALSSIEEQAASMEEINAASNTLASMAEELQTELSKFKL